MLSKGEQTKQAILAKAAQVFSVRGYFGASMDDLMQATGLTKGSLYHHFASKEALALAAFDFAVDLVQTRFREMLGDTKDPLQRLLIYTALFRSLINDPILQGGCPILNAATEVDDTNPALRERVQERLTIWRDFVIRTVARGQTLGLFRPDIIPDSVATILISTLEGSIMMSKLYGDLRFLDQAVDHINLYIHSLRLEITKEA